MARVVRLRANGSTPFDLADDDVLAKWRSESIVTWSAASGSEAKRRV
ncbi:MAG: hypothetical protein U0169_01410 [Polyangiaceae bacterium]